MINPNAGKLPTTKLNLEQLKADFLNPPAPLARVKFGTSGHRGKLGAGFSKLHAMAIAQAVAKIHTEDKIDGKILVGGDTRLMSRPTAEVCAQVLAANGLKVVLPDIAVPTPVFSFEILSGRVCAGLNGTASHNPPEDMGLKYNPSNGGPANAQLTARIEKYANHYLDNPSQIKTMPLEDARKASLVKTADVITPYVNALGEKINFSVIKSAALKAAVHPMGGASLPFYKAIKAAYKLDNLQIVSEQQNPAFDFIPLDHDGKTRMDPSSVYPMKPLIDLVKNDNYQFAGASDPDADRFGCATAKGGLITPNHALCVMLYYLIKQNNPPQNMRAGRTLATTQLIDKIAAAAGHDTLEVNVGFKYFVDGLISGDLIMAGEESAGMSIPNWVTEKDGILAVCLLLQISSDTGQDIAGLYKQITELYGEPHSTRVDIPTTDENRNKIKALRAKDFEALKEIAGEPVERVSDSDGIKIYLQDSWLLVRPSGTEAIIKFYGETFKTPAHLKKLMDEGRKLFNLI